MAKSVVKCPYCQKAIGVETNQEPAPFVRSRITPLGNIKVYRISTEQMKEFLQLKLNKIKEGTKIDLIANSSEIFTKRKKNKDPKIKHKGSIRIAFSHHIIEGSDECDWFTKAGESETNPTILNTVLKNVIQKYSYDRKELGDALNNYKELERLEETYGLTEDFLKEIYAYSLPRAIPAPAMNETWVLFSAMPEKIISDMLENPETNRVEGYIEINDVYPISQGVLEYIVYVHPAEMRLTEHPLVRELLLGGDKK